MDWMKWINVSLVVIAYILGVGDIPFTDLATFTAWLSTHFAGVGGLTLIATAVWYVVGFLKGYVSRKIVAQALKEGRMSVAELAGAVEDAGCNAGPVKGPAADAAYITLMHAYGGNPDATTKLAEGHRVYLASRHA